MNIALDFDRTYTLEPEMWDALIRAAAAKGHKVYIVTQRYEDSEAIGEGAFEGMPIAGIIYCNRQPKAAVVNKRNLHIAVWIDDNPWSIFQSD